MSKVRDISNLSNIIKTDASGNVTFVSGSTTLMSISSSGAVTSTGAIGGSNATTLATTGSNTFTGQQYISNTVAPVNFTDTASLYTDGGLRVGKDAYVSGTLYLNDLTVYGTQSINYITSSQLDISDNIITVNTSTPSIRFGGIAVRDSGSAGTGLTGSLLWDSQNNHWIYTNPSGSSYSGGMLISGPRNTGSMGDEQGTTLNALMKGMGGDHITSSGIFESGSNVGIGTSTPTTGTKLDVVGTIGNFQIGTSGAEIFLTRNENNDILATGGTSSGITIGAQSFLKFKVGTSYTERMSITSAGNVGIGTTSPAELLEVSGSLKIGNLKIQNVNGGSIGFNRNTADGTIYNPGYAAFQINGAYSGANYLDFQNYNSSGSYLGSFVFKDGNFGIGTTSPSKLLHLYNTAATDVMLVESTQVFSTIAFKSSTNSSTVTIGIDGAGNAAFENKLTTGAMAFVTNGSERMRITSAGNILINRTSDNSLGKLQLTGPAWIDFNSYFYFNSRYNGTYYGNILFNNGVGQNLWFGETASNVYAFGTGTANAAITTPILSMNMVSGIISIPGYYNVGSSYDQPNALTINSDANWSFGCSNVSSAYWMQAKFYGSSDDTRGFRVYNVQNSLVEFRINGSGNAYTRGTLTQNASDKRLKTNIINIDKALEKVMSINGVNFDWIENIEELGFSPKIKKNDAGLLAQEIQSVLPQAIDNAPFDYENGESRSGENYLTVQYEKIVPLLVEAIKEQQAQINELKAQING